MMFVLCTYLVSFQFQNEDVTELTAFYHCHGNHDRGVMKEV